MKTKSTKIAFINGYSFGPVARLVLVLMGVLPMLVLLTDRELAAKSLGILLLIFPILAYTSQFGTEFSEDLKSLRQFSLLLGLKKGLWVSSAIYSDLVIIKLNRKWGMTSRSGRSVQFDESNPEIYLMTPDHRHRILIKACKSSEEAIEVSEKLSRLLNKKLVPFNPTISEKSKQNKLKGVK